jgi:hypothetical protein
VDGGWDQIYSYLDEANQLISEISRINLRACNAVDAAEINSYEPTIIRIVTE